MIERPMRKLPDDVNPRTWLGANFWSRVGGPLMWRSFDKAVVREELKVLRDHGLSLTRSFFYWPDFMPEPDTIDETYVERYALFLELCEEERVATIPTFIVGHMSGENWDVSWRDGRDLYSDGWVLAQQAFFVREMSRRFKDHPAIAGWLISNEMPIYGGPTTPEYGKSWAELMVQAVRSSGAKEPVSLGDGAWGMEVTGEDNGFRLRDIAPSVDFMGPHVYPMGDDPVRQHLTAAFNCELAGHFGKPVVLEEFGVTSSFTSDGHAGDYYRQVLHTSLLAGTVGWISWNNTDFDLVDQDPYRHHPFELNFGITRADGTPKAPLLELQKFRKILDDIEVEKCERPPSEVAIVVSSYLETDYSFTVEEERSAIRSALLQSYVTAKEADLAPALVREVDGIPETKLILVPSTKQLTGPSWRALEDLAREGAVVYVSYFPGDVPVQRGLWHPSPEEFFGVESRLRYGLVDPIEDDPVSWSFEEDFGDIRAGENLSFRVAGNEHGRAFLPVRSTEARVLATDGHGRPALLEREIGEGSIVLSTYPLEYLAASRAWANPEDTFRLYRALARRAGVELPVSVDRPDVFADCLVHEDGRRFVWLISESEERVQVTPDIPEGTRLLELSGDGVASVSLPVGIEPYGVRVYELADQDIGGGRV